MLEAAGGGGGGTAWELMTVKTMHEVIHSADTDKQWDIVGGWKKSAELISEHQFQVQDYRDNLAAVWPPQKSPASAAYLERLDQLIANLKETYEAALSNHDALSSATGSIYLAQSQMDKIYQEYTNNENLLAQQTTTQQSSSGGATPSPSPSPSGDEPLVAPGRQEELRQQAVTLLSTVSSDLAAAQLKVSTPTKYTTINPIDDKTTPNNGTTYSAPPIPAVIPAIASDSTASTRSSLPSTTFPTSASPSTGIPVATQPGAGSQPGLVLGGTTSPITSPPSTGISAALPSGGGSTISSPGGFPASGFVPGGGSSAFPPYGTTGKGIGLPREGLMRPGTQLPEGMRAMPSGAVIGGTPGAGQSGAGRIGARRVNPVGGVIGEGEGARGAGTPYGQTGGRRSGRRSEGDGTHWDPDNPWETEEGVDPVVLPPRVQRIDPGPAIGLG